jgi:quinolinate synthase
MAHPECRPDVLALADVIESTSGMLRYARGSDRQSFIVATETGLLHPIRKQNPDKTFYPASEKMVCRDMKRIGLADVAACLENMSGEVKVPEEVRIPALAAVTGMLDLAR